MREIFVFVLPSGHAASEKHNRKQQDSGFDPTSPQLLLQVLCSSFSHRVHLAELQSSLSSRMDFL